MKFVRYGLRTVRENPALIFAEIVWRWTFGATAWLLVIFTLHTIMTGVDVSAAEVALARSNDAYLIADAIARVMVQVLPRFLAAMTIAVPLLAVVWIIGATIGRAVTMRSLVVEDGPTAAGRPTLSLAFLNVIRAIFSLATLLAFFGTVFVVSAQVNPNRTPEAAPAYVLAWLFLAFLVGCFWGLVNWFLALAPIFIVRDGMGVWKALSASVALYRDHRRDYMSIASWFGLFRGAALLVALFAGFVSIAAGWRAGLIASAVIALFYFAVADALYIARLAAYVGLADSPAPQLVSVAPTPEPSATMPSPETETETQTPSELS